MSFSYYNYRIVNKPNFKLSKNSEKLVQKNEKKRLKCIFEKMDSNYDGCISAENIKLEDLTNEELDCLTPFLICNLKFGGFHFSFVIKQSKHA